jgi:hypothetical protein
MAVMSPERRIAEGGPRPTELLVDLGGTVALGQGPGGQEKLRDWFRGFAVLREPCELGPRLEAILHSPIGSVSLNQGRHCGQGRFRG